MADLGTALEANGVELVTKLRELRAELSGIGTDLDSFAAGEERRHDEFMGMLAERALHLDSYGSAGSSASVES